jgi:putative acetyltransferase
MAGVVIKAVQTRTDVRIAAGLFREYAAGLDFSLEYQGFEAELAGLPGRYGAPGGCILLAEVDGEAVGCVALREIGTEGGRRVCEMKRLYVRAIARGVGAGRRLCEELVSRARQVGYAAMKLDTATDMAAAVGLYQSLGFRPCARYNDDPMPCTLFFELEL